MGVKRQSERGFMESLLMYARLMGWRVYHTHDSRRSEEGFPDLVMVRRGVEIFVELKTESGVVSGEQQAWLDDLAATPNGVYVWRPGDWPQIERVLGGN
jgi:hypothetical protein